MRYLKLGKGYGLDLEVLAKMLCIAIVVMVPVLAIVLQGRDIVSMDEFIFVKLSNHLPAYSSSIDWGQEWYDNYYEPRKDPTPEQQRQYEIWMNWWPDAYEAKAYYHPPVANALIWPIVKAVGGEHSNYLALRLFSILLLIGSVFGLALKGVKGCANWRQMLLVLLPIGAGVAIMTGQLNLVYHDLFLAALLALSLLLWRTKYHNWAYLTLSLMVLTKIYAIAFLLPFVIQDRRVLLCGLPLVPYLVWQGWVTGDWLWQWHHWTTMQSWISLTATRGERLLGAVRMLWPFLLVTVPMVVYALRKKRQLLYVGLWLVGGAIGIYWAPYYYQMYPWLVSSTRLYK